MAAAITHTIVALALIGAAVALALTGHDSTPAWGALAGYGIGAGATSALGSRV